MFIKGRVAMCLNNPTSTNGDLIIVLNFKMLGVDNGYIILGIDLMNQSEHKPANKCIITINNHHDLIIPTVLVYPLVYPIHGPLAFFIIDQLILFLGYVVLLHKLEYA
jgi:hypothetical protein